ncbi:MAG: preprotein translocase subunit YajC [Alphaproteobacteria bacterium]|nr:preprotein translocase subunit YajC [Alphaproteobacteria bacterium]
MLISPAYAQAAGGAGGFDLMAILPLVLIFVVFYFLLIRPQQKRAKDHKAMIAAVRRGDTVVTGGGVIGRVTKVFDESEVQVEIADGVRVRVARSTLSEVRTRGEPAKPAKEK